MNRRLTLLAREIDLSWHVMIAPDDWARIQLRHRGTQAWPTRAFEISSVAGHDTPHVIKPDPQVMR